MTKNAQSSLFLNRKDWINADHDHAHEYFFEMADDYVTFPRDPHITNNLELF